jgi:hypothetical protein
MAEQKHGSVIFYAEKPYLLPEPLCDKIVQDEKRRKT